MDIISSQRFTLGTDTSKCTVHSAASANRDVWYFSDLTFESGKIYALVSEYGMWCEYLTYLLGGREKAQNGLRILYNEQDISSEGLAEIGFGLELDHRYLNRPVRKTIEKALSQSGIDTAFEDIAKRFGLTPERWDRKFSQCGNECSRAEAALGYALGRKIFYSGYQTSAAYTSKINSMWPIALRELTDSGAVVLLPAGSDIAVKHFADEIVYLRPDPWTQSLDTAKLKETYSRVTDRIDIIK